MYEAEVNQRTASAAAVPSAVLADLVDYRARVSARSLMPWGEHCTECMAPSCYTTCDLYAPRSDGACRQFVDGVVRIPTPGASVPYLQKITFRRWGKLWTKGSTWCRPLDRADRWERINVVLGAAARVTPAPLAIKHKLLGKVAYLRRERLTLPSAPDGDDPSCFVAEIFNPGDAVASLTLSVRSGVGTQLRVFQKLLTVPQGLLRVRVAFEEMAHVLAGASAFEVELVPNDAENLTLFFGLLDFVKEEGDGTSPAAERVAATSKCKCVVWDLDNTLWHGTLVEDGARSLKLRDGVVETIRALDARGILQSVASKNTADEALAALRAFGLDEYFLYPQINWGPKSQSLRTIAASLNIDSSSFVFIDDQPFERHEVQAALPSVRVLDVDAIATLVERPDFDVPRTDESSRRRSMYREQEQRSAVEVSYGGDYLRFLRDNGMKVFVAPLSEANLTRVFELAQRTNQMNFSGNRYAVEELQRLGVSADHQTFVLRCIDRFGDYGIVGFAVAHMPRRRLLDLMFSCRVQSKRVEHGFLAWLIRRFRERAAGDVHADYRKTAKNAPSGAVFADLGFEEVSVNDGVSDLLFAADQAVPDEGIVTFVME